MSLDFRNLHVGQLETNCYIVWDTDTRKAAIIDPGDDKDLIKDIVEELSLSVEWVLLTHGHFDHAFYVNEIAEFYKTRIGMHAQDLLVVTQSLIMAESFYDVSKFVEFTPSDFLNDGDKISLGGSEIAVIHTPGHSQGGVCFVTSAGVFCGDTIFAGSVGRSDFPGGSHSQLIDSIKSKILSIDDSTPLYPGHGPATTVGEERRSNYYLK